MFETTRQGIVNVISGKDPVNATTVDELSATLETCLAAGQPRIVLDLEKVPLFDSAGLEWLLDASETCAAQTGMLLLAAPNALCRDVLEATGVARQFTLFDNVNAAVRSFAR